MVIGGEVAAARIGDVAKFVDAGDEGADEAEVDEGDEDGGVAGGSAAENGEDSPGGCEDGDDEEDAVENPVSCALLGILSAREGMSYRT